MEKIKLWFLNRKIIFITILIILLAASLIYYFMFYKQDNTIEIISNNIETNTIIEIKEEKEEKEISYISVDIKGYINKPGVYKFDDSIDYRINDLITLAGGLKKDADTSILNLSTKLKDEMVIIIYSKDEIKNFIETINTTKTKLKICETQSIINDACIKEKDLDNTKTIIEEIKEQIININEATKEQLMEIPGIGESKANSIIQYRNENGQFNSIEDIKNVSGIGDKFFEQIKDYITV